MLIAIPSRGRSDRQVTLENLVKSEELRKCAVLCVPRGELRDYEDVAHRYNVVCLGVPKRCDGIAATRKWILTGLADEMGYDRVLMLDDDMDFCRRPKMSDPGLETIRSPRALEKMILTLDSWLDEGFAHVGLSARQGNNHVDTPYVDATRMMNAYAYRVDLLRAVRPRVRFGRVPVMEDFDLTLQLLRAGRPNRVSYRYCWNQRGSGASGGCSEYRDEKMQREAALELKRLHPEFVTVVEKKSKSVWKDMEVRTDVRISWKKAYKSGRSLSEN